MQNKQTEQQLNYQALSDRIVHNSDTQLLICVLEIRVTVKVQIDLLTLCKQYQYVSVVCNIGCTENDRRSKEQSVRSELVPAVDAITFRAIPSLYKKKGTNASGRYSLPLGRIITYRHSPFKYDDCTVRWKQGYRDHECV